MFALLTLVACGPAHRVGKFFAPPDFVVPARDAALARVTYASGWADEDPGPYAPEPFGTVYARPVPITVEGWVELAPLADDVTATVWIRHTGTSERDFRPVTTLTGALPGSFPNEIRFVPEALPLHVAIGDLANPYAGEPLEDGDLVLFEVRGPDGATDRFVFRARDFGFRARFGAGVLVRVPLEGDEHLSPALAGTAAVGYRPRTRRAGVEWVAEQVAVVSSVGIGSTETGEADSLSGAFNAALVGGGLQLFDFVSGQVLINLSSFLRDDDESQVALAIGFDAVAFGRFTERAGSRLLRRNELTSPPE